MTKAQLVKKAIKGQFKNITCIGGRGSAYGWVSLEFDYKRPEDCGHPEQDKWCHCYKCSCARDEAVKKVYQLIKKQNVELYTYCSDDGYNTDSDCMNITVNLVKED